MYVFYESDNIVLIWLYYDYDGIDEYDGGWIILIVATACIHVLRWVTKCLRTPCQSQIFDYIIVAEPTLRDYVKHN